MANGINLEILSHYFFIIVTSSVCLLW